jgi:hypothetical protein
MSAPDPEAPAAPESPPAKVRGFFRGLGEVAEFLRESLVAVFEVLTGKWPQPFGSTPRKPKPPNQGMSPIKKIAPYPTDD